MSSDSGDRMPDPPRVDYSLPKILEIQIRKTRFEPRPMRNFVSSLPPSDDAVEFIVKTDRSIPVRALGAALYVGDTPVTEVTEIGPNTYRFVSPQRKYLKKDAEIRLSWTGEPPAAKGRAFRYRL